MDDPKKRQTTDTSESGGPTVALSMTDMVALVKAMSGEQAKAFAEALGPVLTSVGQVNAEQMQRAITKSNPNFNEVSPYTYPEGELVRPKPRLSRPTFFGKISFQGDHERIVGMRVSDETLTPYEVELFNSITSDRTARNGTWRAQIRQTGSTPELHVGVLMETQDQKLSLPSLVEILKELNSGTKTPSPADLMAQVAELEKKVAQLEAISA